VRIDTICGAVGSTVNTKDDPRQDIQADRDRKPLGQASPSFAVQCKPEMTLKLAETPGATDIGAGNGGERLAEGAAPAGQSALIEAVSAV
jgi:hypothetical protein